MKVVKASGLYDEKRWTEGTMDYCQSEHFRPSCPEVDELLMVHSARYGRLKVKKGGCVSEDFGYIGCSNDVTWQVDAICSGRKSCDILVDQTSFQSTVQCHNDLKSYLEVDVECIKVISNPHRCNLGESTILKQKSGYLSSMVTAQSGCGSADSPWVIQLEEGQRVSVYLIDFGYGKMALKHPVADMTSSTSSKDESLCTVYATIRERSLGRSITICGGKTKEEHVYTSDSNAIEIRFLNLAKDNSKETQFMFKYEAIGCPPPPAPTGGWVNREGKTATIGCHTTDSKWELNCIDGQWIGYFDNCTKDTHSHSTITGENVITDARLPHGVAFAVVVSIAFIIGVIVLIIGLLCLRCKPKSTRKRHAGASHNHHSQSCPSLDRRVLKITMEGHIPRSSAEDPPITENEYSKMKCLGLSPQNSLLDDNALNTVHEEYCIYSKRPYFPCDKCQQKETIYVGPNVDSGASVLQPDVAAVTDREKLTSFDPDSSHYNHEGPAVYFYNNANQTVNRYNLQDT